MPAAAPPAGPPVLVEAEEFSDGTTRLVHEQPPLRQLFVLVFHNGKPHGPKQWSQEDVEEILAAYSVLCEFGRVMPSIA